MSTFMGFAKNLTATLLSEQKLVTELPALMPDLKVVVDGAPLTCTQVVTETSQHLDQEEQLRSLKAQVKAAQAQIKPVRARMRAMGQQVKAAATAAFGSGSPQFQLLGFTPPKTRKTTTAAEKALGAARSLATRVLRGTRGSRQKAALHGVVPAPTPTEAPHTGK
jgi:hypothetical protein